MHYFILSSKGHGETADDHIYASYLCLVGALRENVAEVKSVALARPSSQYTAR
jgi:hypothetical protein